MMTHTDQSPEPLTDEKRKEALAALESLCTYMEVSWCLNAEAIRLTDTIRAALSQAPAVVSEKAHREVAVLKLLAILDIVYSYSAPYRDGSGCALDRIAAVVEPVLLQQRDGEL